MGMFKELAAALLTRTADGVMETRYRLAHLWAIASAPPERPAPPADPTELLLRLDRYLAAREALERMWPKDLERERVSREGGEAWTVLSDEERKTKPNGSMDMPVFLDEVKRRHDAVLAANRHLGETARRLLGS